MYKGYLLGIKVLFVNPFSLLFPAIHQLWLSPLPVSYFRQLCLLHQIYRIPPLGGLPWSNKKQECKQVNNRRKRTIVKYVIFAKPV